MELTELKKGIHASIDEVEDENILLKIAQLLEQQEDFAYEDTEEFKSAIKRAQQYIANGEGYSHEEAMNYLKNRSWRTK